MLRLLLASTALLVAMATAEAATIRFVASTDGGPATTLNTGQDFATVGPVTIGAFRVGADATTMPALPSPGLINANQVSVSSAGDGIDHTLSLNVFADNIVGFAGLQTLLSHFDATGLTPGWTASVATDINGIILNSANFTSISSGVDQSAAFTLPAMFSASVDFLVHTHGIAGASNLGGALSVQPIPLPGAALLFGSGLLGIAALRRRKNKNAAAELAA